MKSIKPGRGPSGLNFVGTIGAIAFGVLWTICAFAMTADGGFGFIGMIFPLFGVIFVVVGIVQAVYHYQNATGKDRYSAFDITEDGEEGDPGQRWVKGGEPWDQPGRPQPPKGGAGFCPYCGAKLQGDFRFCPKCGRELPSE